MTFPLRRQPIKGIYLLCEIVATVLIRIPFRILISLPRSWRPRKSWSLKRVVLLDIVRTFSSIQNRTGAISSPPNHLAIAPGHDVNGVWVEPVPELVQGKLEIWMNAASVKPTRIPGYWIHKKDSKIEVGTPPKPGEKVLLFFHGGAYIRLSAHPSTITTTIPSGIMQHTSIQRTLALEYRLSSSKPYDVANCFPAAVLDALAGYSYLIEVVGFAASDIILVGDSAGGNLVLALTRYLDEYGSLSSALPAPPAGIILLSPWCDLGPSHLTPTGSSRQFLSSDIFDLEDSSMNYARISYLGPHGFSGAMQNPYISPSSLDPLMDIHFKGFPRTFIAAGGAELLYDEITTLKDRMMKDLGDKVTFHLEQDACHDYVALEFIEPERTSTLHAIARWVKIL